MGSGLGDHSFSPFSWPSRLLKMPSSPPPCLQTQCLYERMQKVLLANTVWKGHLALQSSSSSFRWQTIGKHHARMTVLEWSKLGFEKAGGPSSDARDARGQGCWGCWGCRGVVGGGGGWGGVAGRVWKGEFRVMNPKP